MSEENTQKNKNSNDKKSNTLKLCVMILLILFMVSAFVLGMLIRTDAGDRNIGGFIDLSPDFGKNTKFVIIGGRVFYPNKEVTNYTFPIEPADETAVEKKNDASARVITLQATDSETDDGYDDKNKYPTTICRDFYSITTYPLKDNRSKDYKDDVKWIELLTLTDGEKAAWTQDAVIDLFRNDEGRILNLSPGTEGYFRFQINNKSGEPVHAVMTIDEPEDRIHLPMVFCLEDERKENQSPSTVLEKDGAVELSFDIDKDDFGIYRLNWQWPYESGDDAYDGAVGHKAGKYILNVKIYAETVD